MTPSTEHDGLKSTPPENIDHSDEVAIGTRLRRLRLDHRYSIRKLASLAGVSASLISEVERHKVEPSISILKRIASALDTTLVYFFSDDVQGGSKIVRHDQRRSVTSPSAEGNITFELLAPEEATNLEPIYGRYEVSASTGPEPIVHEGEEWGYVLKGRLKVWLADEVFFLDPGDAIWFPSSVPHRIANAAEEATEYIWVNAQKTF